MKHIVHKYNYRPKYYDPFADRGDFTKEIEGDHVCRLYGVMMARMLSGNISIDKMYSIRKLFDAIGPVKECLPQDAFKDLHQCMHFVDNWEQDTDREWDEFYSDSKVGGQR